MVQVPLVPVDQEPEEPEATALTGDDEVPAYAVEPEDAVEPVHERSAEAPEAEPVTDVPVAEPVANAAGAATDDAVVAEAAATPEATADTLEPEAAGGPATRYCAMCGDRVPVDADGLHCFLGHQLSPAHAQRRGWFGRKR